MIDLLLRLAPRERLLLAVLLVVVLPAALWISQGAALLDRRAAAVRALEEARALDLWVTAREAEVQALAALDNVGPRAPIGLSALEQSLIAANLRDVVTGLSNRGGGGIELAFDAVEFEALVAWLSGSDPGWGYDIDSFRITRGDAPGIVAADLRLAPQG